MKQLRNNAFKKVMNHLKELPFIEWTKNWDNDIQSSKGTKSIQVEKYDLTFNYEVNTILEGSVLIYEDLTIRNDNNDSFYELTDPQHNELKALLKVKFNLKPEYIYIKLDSHKNISRKKCLIEYYGQEYILTKESIKFKMDEGYFIDVNEAKQIESLFNFEK